MVGMVSKHCSILAFLSSSIVLQFFVLLHLISNIRCDTFFLYRYTRDSANEDGTDGQQFLQQLANNSLQSYTACMECPKWTPGVAAGTTKVPTPISGQSGNNSNANGKCVNGNNNNANGNNNNNGK
jgi:hypothetical protein